MEPGGRKEEPSVAWLFQPGPPIPINSTSNLDSCTRKDRELTTAFLSQALLRTDLSKAVLTFSYTLLAKVAAAVNEYCVSVSLRQHPRLHRLQPTLPGVPASQHLVSPWVSLQDLGSACCGQAHLCNRCRKQKHH